MSKIDNPFYGKVGAFWIEGRDEPFYGLHEAKQYQHDKGGDILNYKGRVIIHEPEAPAIVEEMTSPMVKTKESKGWFSWLGL